MSLSQTAQKDEFQFLHLKYIEVTFKSKLPKYPLRIKIILRESVAASKEFAKHDPLRWEPNVHVSLASSIEIVVKQSRTIKWRAKHDFAFVRFEEAEIGKDDIVTKDDERGLLSVKLVFEPQVKAVSVVREGAENAVDLLKAKPIALDKLGKARKFVEVVKRFGDVLADVHPAAKAAVVAFDLLYEKFEEQEKVHKDASELIDELQLFLPFTEVVDPVTLTNEAARSAIKEFLILFKETCEFIVQFSSSGILGDLLSSQGSRIKRLEDGFRKAKNKYDWSIKTDVWKINLKLEKTQDNEVLKLLQVTPNGPAGKEFYRTDKSCLADTRTSVLERISQWAESTTDRKLFWLHGAPGSGKSAIANSVGHKFDGRRLLAGCFFCRRDDADLRDTNKIIPSLAVHLSAWHQPFCAKLLTALQGEEQNKLASKSLHEQFELLIKGPILALSSDEQSLSPTSLIIVIDALDACGRNRGQRIQLAKILVQVSELVPWLKLFVTSRHLPELRQVLESRPDALEELDLDQAGDPSEDIILYSKHRAEEIGLENGLRSDWLDERHITTIVQKSQGRFIWASTVFDFIASHTDIDYAVEVVLSVSSINFDNADDDDLGLLCMRTLRKAEADSLDDC